APVASRLAAAAVEVGLEDVRVRSYPSFTRIVVETSAAVTHRIESSGPKEARVRLVGLGSGTNAQEIGDGLIAEVRLDRAGADGILRAVYEGAAGTLRAMTLADPPRIVLDVSRPVDPGTRESREQIAPLKTIVLDAGHGGHDTGATGPTGWRHTSCRRRRRTARRARWRRSRTVRSSSSSRPDAEPPRRIS